MERAGSANRLMRCPTCGISLGCVKSADIDGDGDLDLFAGGRIVPGKYPMPVQSAILINDGKGKFIDGTNNVCPALSQPGMVTDAAWVDINKDGKQDLVVVGEWMPVKVFINSNGKLIDAIETIHSFCFVGMVEQNFAEDFDDDGDMDLMHG